MSEVIIKKIGPNGKDAIPALIDSLKEDCEENVCRWDGDQTVNVSEYVEDELGEFYRITSAE